MASYRNLFPVDSLPSITLFQQCPCVPLCAEQQECVSLASFVGVPHSFCQMILQIPSTRETIKRPTQKHCRTTIKGETSFGILRKHCVLFQREQLRVSNRE